ncbi:hypothetical protein DFH09DRAFT_1303897 [Mycena vulgaris]|nr:hypothetical protein DFH09DRAFT_1303897 [Mycena vulgaris]
MFKSFVVVGAIFATVAAAASTARQIAVVPIPPQNPPNWPMCCNSVVPSSDPSAIAVAELLGMGISRVLTSVGLSCADTPFVGGDCAKFTVFCIKPDPAWGGLIAFNCIPVTL